MSGENANAFIDEMANAFWLLFETNAAEVTVINQILHGEQLIQTAAAPGAE